MRVFFVCFFKFHPKISKSKLDVISSERLKKTKKKFHPKGQDVEGQTANEQELTPMDHSAARTGLYWN